MQFLSLSEQLTRISKCLLGVFPLWLVPTYLSVIKWAYEFRSEENYGDSSVVLFICVGRVRGVSVAKLNLLVLLRC